MKIARYLVVRNEECICCSELPQISNKNRDAVEMGNLLYSIFKITAGQAVFLNLGEE